MVCSVCVKSLQRKFDSEVSFILVIPKFLYIAVHGSVVAFSVLISLVGWQKGHLSCKIWVVKCWCGSVWGKVQICIWPCWCHCHSLSLAPVNPDWFYLSGTGYLGSPEQMVIKWLLLQCRLSQREPLKTSSSHSALVTEDWLLTDRGTDIRPWLVPYLHSVR